jgi:L-alanine-DL-glutamate epimerase-like enolase superfamily enzyme
MRLSFNPFDLSFKHPFTVSGFSRTSTPIVMIQLEHEGKIGYGEATMPPYLGETQESVGAFLQNIDLHSFNDQLDIESILEHVDSIAPGNNAAKAGFDIALHDLIGKIKGVTVSEYYNIQRTDPPSSFTIGIDTPELMANKVFEAQELGFKVLKIKLGSDHDQAIMKRILSVWEGPFSIDANQGWKDKEQSLDFVHQLKEHGASFIEQPFEKEDLHSSAWLTERSPLPIIADESVKRLTDLEQAKNCFHGINVKLMKSTGLREAFKMIQEARRMNMKVVTGCMAESSCAVTAMANFASLADWVDLDGPFLITNDPFHGITLKEGRINIPDSPGIGVTLNDQSMEN